jgi:hypothetical protein
MSCTGTSRTNAECQLWTGTPDVPDGQQTSWVDPDYVKTRTGAISAHELNNFMRLHGEISSLSGPTRHKIALATCQRFYTTKTCCGPCTRFENLEKARYSDHRTTCTESLCIFRECEPRRRNGARARRSRCSQPFAVSLIELSSDRRFQTCKTPPALEPGA